MQRHRDTEIDAETETQRYRETETQRYRKTWIQRDPESETRSRRRRRRARGGGGEASRVAAGTGASGLAAPARPAETRLPSWGFSNRSSVTSPASAKNKLILNDQAEPGL